MILLYHVHKYLSGTFLKDGEKWKLLVDLWLLSGCLIVRLSVRCTTKKFCLSGVKEKGWKDRSWGRRIHGPVSGQRSSSEYTIREAIFSGKVYFCAWMSSVFPRSRNMWLCYSWKWKAHSIFSVYWISKNINSRVFYETDNRWAAALCWTVGNTNGTVYK